MILAAATLILGGLILGAIGILWSIHITLCRVRNQLAALIMQTTTGRGGKGALTASEVRGAWGEKS